MSTDTAPPGAPARGREPRSGRRMGLPLPTSSQGMPVRRRWGRVAAGAVLALLGGWISVALYVSAGDRVEVVALARDVEQYDELTRDDLRTVRVAADPSIQTVGGGDVDDLVGRRPAVYLLEGTLLSPDQLVPEDEDLVTSGEAVVALELQSNEVADSILRQGTVVRVVMQPGQSSSTDEPREVPGWILEVEERDEDTGERALEVVVSQTDAGDVAVASADGRVSVVADGAI